MFGFASQKVVIEEPCSYFAAAIGAVKFLRELADAHAPSVAARARSYVPLLEVYARSAALLLVVVAVLACLDERAPSSDDRASDDDEAAGGKVGDRTASSTTDEESVSSAECGDGEGDDDGGSKDARDFLARFRSPSFDEVLDAPTPRHDEDDELARLRVSSAECGNGDDDDDGAAKDTRDFFPRLTSPSFDEVLETPWHDEGDEDACDDDRTITTHNYSSARLRLPSFDESLDASTTARPGDGPGGFLAALGCEERAADARGRASAATSGGGAPGDAAAPASDAVPDAPAASRHDGAGADSPPSLALLDGPSSIVQRIRAQHKSRVPAVSPPAAGGAVASGARRTGAVRPWSAGTGGGASARSLRRKRRKSALGRSLGRVFRVKAPPGGG